MSTLFNWYRSGISDGWIELYEQELVRYLEAEYGNLTDTERLIAVFTSLYLKAGHVSLPIGQSPAEWVGHLDLDGAASSGLPAEKFDRSELDKSRLVGIGREEKPFILHGDQISVRRFFMYENRIADWISSKSEKSYQLAPDFPFEFFHSLFEEDKESPNWQQVAVVMSFIKPFLIISGGPGTGKTTTVAKILAMKMVSSHEPLRIALAAPTGKAAGRMAESLYREMDQLNVPEEKRSQLPDDAATLHRLLYGLDRGGLLPDPEKKKLRYDLIIVDEASMIDLNLMHRLISHIGEGTQLILLGDKDQLASVEAGSVFADLCRKPENGFLKETAKLIKQLMPDTELPLKEQSVLSDSVLYLTKSYRFDSESGIGKLAALVKRGEPDAEGMKTVMDGSSELSCETFNFSRDKLEELAGNLAERVKEVQNIRDERALLDFWKRSAWLTVLRRGPEGSRELNRLVEKILILQRSVQPENGWYHGRPIIITRNSYSLGVFNGDMGVCLHDGSGELRIYVESGSEIKKLQPSRLTDYAPAYFLTVHKSQGSEFNHVNLLLPKRDTPILTRELLYTAITRARNSFTLYGEMGLFAKGVSRQTVRYTGLKNLVE
ncbi:exodeoxyribonuclease V subunit alpha [Rhodohalobacter halophilus]|uniref:exodeoxyribonuclease V subunit alpha n=1 Tax=Rhodohalobacter halophilus TaxID=1812810 RepID=UPI00083FBCF1|nr:exodeoxyribonuclease V subunit alpha [Rhodohalobacter halophilus]